MVTMNEVVAFIDEAMDKKLPIYEYFLEGLSIKNNLKEIRICPDGFGKKLYVRTNNGNFEISITEREFLEYKLKLDDVKKYIINQGINDFYNFFLTDNSCNISIDDINDDDN